MSMRHGPAVSLVTSLTLVAAHSDAAAHCTSSTAAPNPQAEQTPAAPRSIDPKAKAIIDRGLEAAKSLQSLEVVSALTLEGPDAAQHAQGSDTPARWLFDFRGAGQELPYRRVAIESLKDGAVTRRVTFDGRAARSVDESRKTFMTGSLPEVADHSTAMPGWFIDGRLGIAPVGSGPDDMSLPPLAVAAVVGEETLDGVPCDVVRSVRARMQPPMQMPDGTAIPAREMRIVETIAFARTDGLPRRVRFMLELEGVPSDGISSVSTFTGVKPNAAVDDATFATAPVDGYARQDLPKRMAQGAEGLKVAAGEPAPDFTLIDLDGMQVTLSSLKGRVVLLDFWATWCGPCKAAMPAIEKIHEDYAGKPVTVLAVNVGERKPDAGPAYFREKGFSYGCLLAGEALANAYGISGIPTLVVIGTDGRVALIETGLGPEGDAALRAAIDRALVK